MFFELCKRILSSRRTGASSQATAPRLLRCEPLESRELLSVVGICGPSAGQTTDAASTPALVSELTSNSQSEPDSISLATLDESPVETGDSPEENQTTSADAAKYTFDVNFTLDGALLYEQGISDIKAENIGSFDVYINDELYAENVGDFCEDFVAGTKVEVKNFKFNEGYEFLKVSPNTSWNGYGTAVGVLSGTIQPVTNGPNEILLNLATVDTTKYTFDVNFTLDGKLLYEQGITDIKAENIGSFDVYVNDELYAENVGDFYEDFAVGTKVEVKNIKLNEGYEFLNVAARPSWSGYGVAVGALSGTIQRVSSGANEILLNLATVDTTKYTFDVNFTLDGKLLYEQGVTDIKAENIGSFDVYVNDELYAENVGDFYEDFAVGTKVEVKNIQLNEGYEFLKVSPITSWSGYGLAVGALSGTVQPVTKGPNEILLNLATVDTTKYVFDVNFSLDGKLLYEQGVTDIKAQNIGAFDVYVNDELYATNVGDFCQDFVVGTKVEVKNIKLNKGYEFLKVSPSTSWSGYGLAVGALSGTIKKVSSGPNEILIDLATKVAPTVTFSAQAGVNLQDQELELFAPLDCSVYYTVDGSDPTADTGILYTGSLSLTANASRFAAESNLINILDHRIYDNAALPKAVTVKAIAVSSWGETSPVETRTYFFQEREPIAVISISTDYDNLLDYDTGIMVKGAYYDAWVNTPEAAAIIANQEVWHYVGNYTQKGKDWERPATIEIFDGDNYLVENCGIRIRGGFSRSFAQKSFNVYFRKEYGAKELDYTLLEDAVSVDGDVISAYKGFSLRNGGNDTKYLKFRDAMIQNLVKDLNVATQASRPALLYLNGEYMGIYILQEKLDDRFIQDHYNVDKDNVVVIEEGVVGEGKDEDIALYEDLQSYANRDMSDSETYREFCNVVDVDSMIDYYATQIYIGNADWNPTKNTRLWRVRTPENDAFGDGKWRWILYDTDYCMGIYGSQEKVKYHYDSFSVALDADPLFANILNNSEFYSKFVEKVQDLAENNFSTANVNAALDSFSSEYKPYMSDYYKRYGNTSGYWNSQINAIKQFVANRARYILAYIEDYQSR